MIASEREGGPYTLLETFFCGTPVVSTKCGDAVIDLVVDGYNGLLMDDPIDHKAVAARVSQLLDNPRLLAEFSENALKKFARERPMKLSGFGGV